MERGRVTSDDYTQTFSLRDEVSTVNGPGVVKMIYVDEADTVWYAVDHELYRHNYRSSAMKLSAARVDPPKSV